VWRTAVRLAAVGLLLAGCGTEGAGRPAGSTSQAPTSTAAPPSTTIPTCPESGVQVTTGVVDAAMGLRVMAIELTNCGAQTYTVTGYPVLTLLDEERQPFDVQVLHGAEPITRDEGFCTPTGQFDAGPQPVTLAAGERAVARVVWRNLTTDEFDHLVNATYLSVAPSAGEMPHEVAPNGGIDLGTTGQLGVSAWEPEHTNCS
jgi:hypothetical protein